MAKHRTISFKLDKFFTAVEGDLLRDYFTKCEIAIPANIGGDGKSFADLLEGLQDKGRKAEIEEELQCINDIADQTRDHLEQAIKEFKIPKTEDETPETTAMRVFLHENKEAFSLAFDKYLFVVYSDKLSHHKFPTGTADFRESNMAKFQAAVEQHFKSCGKSKNCNIRNRTEGDKQVLLIARGDFPETHLVFEDKKPDIKSFRPLRDEMLVFDPKNLVLSINIKGRSDEDKNKYIEMFGNTIMGLQEIPKSTFNDSLVTLDPIKGKRFNYDGNAEIEGVKLTEVKAKQKGAGPIRLTVNAPDVSKSFDRYHLSSESTEFISAKLKFIMKRDGKKSKHIPVEIKPPTHTKLPEKKERKIIENYLRDQGVLLV